MPSYKRPSDAHDNLQPVNKVARTDQGDFSGAVKKKLSGATRTGQACDRCKVRKIRCDARPGGCSPCLQNNSECRTTDRITGRATSRGYTENVETQNSALKQHVHELLAQLQENGIEPRPAPVPPPTLELEEKKEAPPVPTESPYSLSSILNQEENPKERTRSSVLPDFKTDSVGDNYLGVSSANEWPLPITGTHHALFGMHLDLRDFTPIDANGPSSAMSYRSFQKYAFTSKGVEAPDLPSYEHLRSLVHWFFNVINPWAPVLHKPAIYALIDRIHTDPTYEMTLPERVQLHMLITAMLYQYSARNGTNTGWIAHYKYALSFYPQLIGDMTLAGMQAVATTLLVLRAFPRPGAVWMISSWALIKAIEMGLHRSVTAWSKSQSSSDEHESEMRKRVFWGLLTCHVTVGAKLGRPLILRIEDFDVEFPKPIPDYLPEESGLSEWRKCSFHIGIYGMRLLVMYMQVYTSIYNVRPTLQQPYELMLKQMDKELSDCYAAMPSEIRSPDLVAEEKVFAVYIDFTYQHLRLLLHHPALCRTPNQELTANNLDICLDASNKLLHIAADMQKLKSLDTTWFNTTVFLAAIFTTLFAFLERKDSITSSEFTSLRKDMDNWLNIIGEIGVLLGSGSLLQDKLRQIVSSAMANINKHLAAKTASAAVASAEVVNSAPRAQSNDHSAAQQIAYQASASMTAPNSYHAQNTHTAPPDVNSHSTYMAHDQPSIPSQPSFSTAPQAFAYPDPAQSSMPAYNPAPMPFDSSAYSEDIKPDLSAQLAAHNAALQQQQTPTPHPHAQQPQFYGYTNGYPSDHRQPQTGSMAWRQFADNMMHNFTPPHQQQHWSANALMALQTQNSPMKNGTQPGAAPDMSTTGVMPGMDPANAAVQAAFDLQAHHPQSWPLMGGYPQNGA